MKENIDMKKFDTVVSANSINMLKELVNLTYNLRHYTLIQDLSSMRSIEQTYMLNIKASISEKF